MALEVPGLRAASFQPPPVSSRGLSFVSLSLFLYEHQSVDVVAPGYIETDLISRSLMNYICKTPIAGRSHSDVQDGGGLKGTLSKPSKPAKRQR